MRNEKGITVIAILLVIIIIFGGILAFKVMSDKKETENIKTSSTPNTSTNYNSSTSNNNSSSSSMNNSSVTTGLGKEFKQAMDSYEATMDEYIAFMTKYTNSNTKTSQMLIDYGEWMKKYIDMVDAFEKWESNNLNKEEAKYYVEVQMRVSQKLINASIDVAY